MAENVSAAVADGVNRTGMLWQGCHDACPQMRTGGFCFQKDYSTYEGVKQEAAIRRECLKCSTIRRFDNHNPSWYLDTKTSEGDSKMKAMTLRLDEKEYERLRTLAYVEDRAISDVIREAIFEYIQRKASHDDFRASLERALQENAQLIAELAKH